MIKVDDVNCKIKYSLLRVAMKIFHDLVYNFTGYK